MNEPEPVEPDNNLNPLPPDSGERLTPAEPAPPSNLKLSYKKVALIASAIRSWIFTIVIIIAGVALLKLIFQQVADKSYHIQAFSLPDEFVKQGYDGVTVAYGVLDNISSIIQSANSYRSVKEVEEYNNSSDKTTMQVEVPGGIALSLDNIAAILREALGMKERTIAGKITGDDKELKLMLRVTGQKVVVIHQAIDSTGRVAALERLMNNAAASILQLNNPFLLSLYYYNLRRSESTYPEKAVEMLKQTILTKPEQAAEAYATWAQLLSSDTAVAMTKIRKALSLNPNSAYVYRSWGLFIYSQGQFKKAKVLFEKALKLDPTSSSAWRNLGSTYLSIDAKADSLAEVAFRKSLDLNPESFVGQAQLAEAMYHQGKYEKAYDAVERAMLNEGTASDGTALAIVIYEALGDTLGAQKLFAQAKQNKNAVLLSNNMNNIAYDIETHGHYKSALRYINMALMADSLNPAAGYVYSTRAELLGLLHDREGFYRNFERCLEFGMDVWGELENVEPYTTYSKEDRYKALRNKYQKKAQ